MNESVGYTVTINIVITFIIIVFVFLSNVLVYYKSNKVGNVIVESIEKYSGFNELSKQEIERNLSSIGYNRTKITCTDTVPANEKNGTNCTIDDKDSTEPNGYCVYYCDAGNNYYYYKVKANMIINIPIINNIVNGTVFSSTINIYDFKGVDSPAPLTPEYKVGDVDHDDDLTILDATKIRRYLNGEELNDFYLSEADYNGDGQVTNEDCEEIQKYLLK